MFKPFKSLSVIAILGTDVAVGAGLSVGSCVGFMVALGLMVAVSVDREVSGFNGIQAANKSWLMINMESKTRTRFRVKKPHLAGMDGSRTHLGSCDPTLILKTRKPTRT